MAHTDEQLAEATAALVEGMKGETPDPEPEQAIVEPEVVEDSGSPDEPVVPEPEPEPQDVVPEPQIDYDMAVPMPDGMPDKTLGELKDLATDIGRRESQIQDRENELLRQNQELSAMMGQMGEIPPQLRERAAQQKQDHLRREHELMVQAIPEMGDREGFERVSKAVNSLLGGYGFSGQEIAQMSDHRAVKLAKDFADLKRRVATAEKRVADDKPVRAAPSKRGVNTGKQRVSDALKKADATGFRSDQVAAGVEVLLQSMRQKK